jgi:hypothetical protein
MRKPDQQPSLYVVYPAALFDGWEVVKEHVDDEALFFATKELAIRYAENRAAMEGGGVVKLENWFGDTEDVWEVTARPATVASRRRSGADQRDASSPQAPAAARSPRR